MMAPDADHVKISIWPGVSIKKYSRPCVARCSTKSMTLSNRVAKRLSAVMMPPFGPAEPRGPTISAGTERWAGTQQQSSEESRGSRTELVLLHDLLVVDRVANVNVGGVGHVLHGGVEVDEVARVATLEEMGIEPLHQRRLAAARHSDHDRADGALATAAHRAPRPAPRLGLRLGLRLGTGRRSRRGAAPLLRLRLRLVHGLHSAAAGRRRRLGLRLRLLPLAE